MKKFLSITAALAIISTLSAVESVPGVRGKAARIDGRESFLSDPSGRKFDYSQGFTLSVAIRPEAWAQGSSIIADAGTFSLSKRSKGNKGFYFWGTIGGQRQSALVWSPEKFVSPLRKWILLAVTYDPVSGMGTGYLNGNKVAQWDVDKRVANKRNKLLYDTIHPAVKFRLGDGAVPYIGAIDELYIYGKVLNAAEINKLHYDGIAPEGAQAIYKFDDPQNIGLDSSGNNRHLEVKQGFLAQKPPRTGSPVKTDYLFANDDLTVWGRPATEKNMPADRPVRQQLSTAPLANLAGNEYESFQIAVTTPKALKDLKLEVSSFTQGTEKLNFTIATVNYVAIPQISQTAVKGGDIYGEAGTAFNNITAKPGYYPDVLRPGNVFKTAPANESSAFYITVKSAIGQKPGIYTAQAKLFSQNNLLAEFPISVNVWDFSLPKVFHTTNSGVARDSMGQDSEAWYKNCAEHYVSLLPLRANVKVQIDRTAGTVTLDTAAFDREARLAIDKYGFLVLDMPGWGFYNTPKAAHSNTQWHGIPIHRNGGVLTDEFKKYFGIYLRKISAHLKKNGWFDEARIMLVDEPWTAGDFAVCQQFAKLIRENAPGLEIGVTKWPQKALMGAPDTWILGFIYPEDLKAAIKRGEKIEWYPNWHVFIDRPLMDSRMIGFMMWKYQITGILFWKLNHGWSNPANLEAPRFVYPDGRVICGSGLLVYPDSKNRPISSLRWEMMRDCFEDFEYFYMLNELAQKANDQETLQFIKAACDDIVKGYYAKDPKKGYGWQYCNWETDANKLQQYRIKLAESIIKLSKK